MGVSGRGRAQSRTPLSCGFVCQWVELTEVLQRPTPTLTWALPRLHTHRLPPTPRRPPRLGGASTKGTYE